MDIPISIWFQDSLLDPLDSLDGGLRGPFYSHTMRLIAQDFLAWLGFDEPDAPPAVTYNSLLKAALFFLPSTFILFDVLK